MIQISSPTSAAPVLPRFDPTNSCLHTPTVHPYFYFLQSLNHLIKNIDIFEHFFTFSIQYHPHPLHYILNLPDLPLPNPIKHTIYLI